jgi:hypothetical protein
MAAISDQEAERQRDAEMRVRLSVAEVERKFGT